MKRVKQKKYLLFISHSSKDRWIARHIRKEIEARFGDRIEIFLADHHLLGGQPIREAILKKIRDCSEILVLMSRYSIDSGWVIFQVGAASGLHKYIVAIIDKVSPQEMPSFLSSSKAIDLNEFEKYLRELGDRIGRRAQR